MLEYIRIENVDVIAPNFKRRLSGVTSTIIQLVPQQAKMGLRIATLGPGLPDHLPYVRLRDLWQLWKKPNGKPYRVWHARRNVEMIVGLILRDLLGIPLKLVFTSAAQRKHQRFTRFLIGRMDRVVATNMTTAAFLKVPNQIILHGIDTERFVPNAAARRKIRNELKLDANQKIAGCFGRVRHQKGTDLFVSALIELLPKYPCWIGIICGRVTAEHAQFTVDLKTRIAAAGLSGRIQFLGEVADILPFYQAADLYVAPSRNEGFGLTPLEAMACGVPVVASTAGAYRDMIQPGINGEICEAGNRQALTIAIEKMFSTDEALAAMGMRAKTYVQENFALEIEAMQLNRLYASLFELDFKS